MKTVYVSLVHRIAEEISEEHGYLLKIDWETKNIIDKVLAPPIYKAFQRRNRGGRRGFRGITKYGGLIYVASCDSLYGFEPKTLELKRMITHPYMGAIHEIEATSEGIWVTATVGAGIFLIDEFQNVKAESWLLSKPTNDLRIPTMGREERFHLNTIYISNATVYAYSHCSGQLFKMWPLPVKKVRSFEIACHNVVNTEYGWFRNLSEQASIKIGDNKLKLPERGNPKEFTKPGWVRGMAQLENGNFLVGNSPASVYEIDPRKIQIIDSMQIRDEVCWTVHGIFIDRERTAVSTDVKKQTYFKRNKIVWKKALEKFRYRLKIYAR